LLLSIFHSIPFVFICLSAKKIRIQVHLLTCVHASRQLVANNHLIFICQEKWDSISRRWKDNKAIIKQIQLFMIDEVHMLNDSSRGATGKISREF